MIFAHRSFRQIAAWILGLSLIFAARAHAGLFDRTPKVTPAFSYAETSFDRSRETIDSEGYISDDLLASSYSSVLSARLSLAGLNITTLSADSPVAISIGTFKFRSTLGLADNYKPGKRLAIFTVATVANDGFSRRVVLSWTPDALTISAVTRFAGVESPSSLDSIGLSAFNWDRWSEYWPYNDFTAEVTFDTLTGSRAVHAQATSVYTGPPYIYETVGLATTTWRTRGAAIFTLPAIQVVRPGRGASLLTATPELVVNSPSAVTVQAATNGGPAVDLEFREDGLWALKLQLHEGANDISLTAKDIDDNTRVLPSFRLTYRPIDGTYQGLATFSPDGPAGTFLLRMAATKAFTGSMTLAGVPYSFKGSFAGGDTTTVSILRRGKDALQLSLTLGAEADGANSVTGSVTVDGAAWSLAGGRLIYDGRNVVCPSIGPCTLALAPGVIVAGADLPRGHGWAAARVSSAGVVAATGRLADGTPFSFSGRIDAAGNLPVALRLNGGIDHLSGILAVHGAAVSGTLDWHRSPRSSGRFQSGFTLTTTVTGSGYAPGVLDGVYGETAPDGLYSATISYGGLVAHLSLDGRGKISVTEPGPTAPTLSLENKSGVFNGTFYDQGGRLRSMSGVLMPDGGHGYSLTDTGSIPVDLTDQ